MEPTEVVDLEIDLPEKAKLQQDPPRLKTVYCSNFLSVHKPPRYIGYRHFLDRNSLLRNFGSYFSFELEPCRLQSDGFQHLGSEYLLASAQIRQC